MHNYPTFWTWYTSSHKHHAKRLVQRCEELKIPVIAEHLDVEKYAKSLEYVRGSLSHKRFIFKAGLLFLRDRFLALQKPLFYLHSDSNIIIKPEKFIFDNKKIGYCIAEKQDGQKIIASHGLYFDYCQLSDDFLNVLCYKCQKIRGEKPTEHGAIRTTIFDFTGNIPDDKMIKNGNKQKFKSTFTLSKHIRELCGDRAEYILSKNGNAYMGWK